MKAEIKPNTAYLFVEVETKVYRKGVEISSENPEETRWYMSNIVVQPEDVPSYSLIKQKVMPYFSKDVRLNGDVSVVSYLSREEAEDQRKKEIEYRKGQGGNIIPSNWSGDRQKAKMSASPS